MTQGRISFLFAFLAILFCFKFICLLSFLSFLVSIPSFLLSIHFLLSFLFFCFNLIVLLSINIFCIQFIISFFRLFCISFKFFLFLLSFLSFCFHFILFCFLLMFSKTILGGYSLSDSQNATLTPMHLRKAKLMFFWVRYPSSAILKMYFPDIKFNKNNTAQLVKWFSNFRSVNDNQLNIQ